MICVKRVSYSINVKNVSCTHHGLLLSNTATRSYSCSALIRRPWLPALFLQPLKVTLNNKHKSRTNVLPQSTHSAVFLLRTCWKKQKIFLYKVYIFSISLKCRRKVKNTITGSLSSRWNSWIASSLSKDKTERGNKCSSLKIRRLSSLFNLSVIQTLIQ